MLRSKFLFRLYATEAKTAVKSKKGAQSEADMPPLSPFILSPTTKHNIPDVSDMSPSELGMRWKASWQTPHFTKMRGIDVVLREQYEAVQKDRWELFDKQIQVGSIVMVENVTSRTVPRKQVNAGIIIDKAYCGIASHYTLLSLVKDTFVYMQMPLYNPNVLTIRVLGSFTDQEMVDNGLMRQGSIRKFYDDHEVKLRTLAQEIKDKGSMMDAKRETGKKNPTSAVQQKMLSSEYMKQAKILMRELRLNIKQYKRGTEPNREWSGWSQIDELRQRAI